jgi:hypothetical protein
MAIAVESARAVTTNASRWWSRALLVLAGLVVARAVSANEDAQYFMKLGTPRISFLAAAVVIIPLAVALAVAAPRAARVAVPFALALVAVASVTALAIAPIVDGPPWAIIRRGVPDLFGNGCTLADHLLVTDPRSATPLPTTTTAEPVTELAADKAQGAHPPLPELAHVAVYATDGVGFATTGTLTSPWFTLPDAASGRDVVVAATGRTEGGNELTVEWGLAGEPNAAFRWLRLELDRAPPPPASRWMGWRLARLPAASWPANARTVRLVAHDRGQSEGDYVAFSAPVAVESTPLADHIAGRTVLVSPPQLPLLHCVDLPRLDDGIAAAPDLAVGFQYNRNTIELDEIGSASGPWYLADDAYGTRRLWAWVTDSDAVMLVQRDDTLVTDQLIGVSIEPARS